MNAIEELTGLCELATGPDRWLDAKIDAALRIGSEKMRGVGYEWAWDNFPVWAPHKQARGMCGVQHDNGDLGMVWDSPEFTASVDAAIALAVRLLDNGAVDIEVAHRSVGGKAFGRAEICGPHVDQSATGATPAIALCLCVLRALQSQEPTP